MQTNLAAHHVSITINEQEVSEVVEIRKKGSCHFLVRALKVSGFKYKGKLEIVSSEENATFPISSYTVREVLRIDSVVEVIIQTSGYQYDLWDQALDYQPKISIAKFETEFYSRTIQLRDQKIIQLLEENTRLKEKLKEL